MPKSRRDKQVSLQKVQKKTRDHKNQLIETIQENLKNFSTIYLLNIDNLRTSFFQKIREQLKSSRFFCAKRTLMKYALLHHSHPVKSLHQLVERIGKNNCLMFTNEPLEVIQKALNENIQSDCARSGFVTPSTITLEKGHLETMIHSMEPQLRQLNLPITLKKGDIYLDEDFIICKENDVLNNVQCRLLSLFGYKLAKFQVTVIGFWSKKEDKFEKIE
ncbi:hypothetical protein SNEBB_001015 [Seison nebaliae]|nr:hypothetical protein SNEBB_001015 [Seison nebaliae]